MPYMPLYKRLLEKTNGRLIQSDVGLPDGKVKISQQHSTTNRPPYTDALWEEVHALIESQKTNIDAFRQDPRFQEQPLYFEYTLLDE
jgi:hypothetical protein